MGVKRAKDRSSAGKPPLPAEAERAQKVKAKRQARIVLGAPPPSKVLIPKRMKPAKHKKPADAEEE